MAQPLLKVLMLSTLLSALPGHARTLAATPPMGWNSWDAYGFTIDEAQFKANAQTLASFKSYGWSYAVIDEGWYLVNPEARAGEFLFNLDSNGRLIPDPRVILRPPRAPGLSRWPTGSISRA